MVSFIRRSLLVAFLCLIGMPLFPGITASADVERTGTGKIVAREVRQPIAGPAAGTAALGSVDQPGTPSAVIDAGIRFGHVGLHWTLAEGADEHDAELELRASVDGVVWGEWLEVHDNHDMADELARERYAHPQYVGAARYAQYRLSGVPGAATAVSLTFIDADDLNLDPLTTLAEDLKYAWQRATTPPAADAASVQIKTRAQWGADESLMRWRPEREPWQKAIVHHTVTSNNYATAASEIRSIYYYHAVTRGWGDIGYSFLIDKYGNVWQGRAGGDDVVAGHAYGWNEGTFGVSFLGDFTRIAPTPASLQAAGNLIGSKFAARGIAPFGASRFTHYEQQRTGAWVGVTRESPNIIGHRDANYVAGASGGQTACPGQLLWDRLDDIRRLAQSATVSSPYYAALSMSQPASLRAGARSDFSVVVKNQGSNPISAATTRLGYWLADANTGRYIGAGPTFALGGNLAPGASRSVPVAFTAPTTRGFYVVNWDLQIPGNAWFADLYGTPVVRRTLAVTDLGVEWTNTATPSFAEPSSQLPVSITVKNTGVRTWVPGEFALSYHLYDDLSGQLVAWDGQRGALTAAVAPGASATIALRIALPGVKTRYRIRYDMVHEGQGWFSDFGAPRATAFVNVGFDYSATYTTPAALSTSPGETKTVPLTISNPSAREWPAGVVLGTHIYRTDGSLLEWNGVRTALPSIGPGESATVNARVLAPAIPGGYRVAFDLVNEGVAWFSSMGVTPAATGLTVVRVDNARYDIGSRSGTGLPVTVTNTGLSTLRASEVFLSYHLWRDGAPAVWDGPRLRLPRDLAPGASATILVTGLPTSGDVEVRFDLVREGVAWFSQLGVATGDRGLLCRTTEWTARYYRGRDLTGKPVASRCSSQVSYRLSDQARASGLGKNEHSIAWTRDIAVPVAASYIFTARADDGVRVYVDGARIIDQWRTQTATTFNATRALAAGDHRVRVEYFQAGGKAEMSLSLSAVPQPAKTTTPVSAPPVDGGRCQVGQFAATYYRGTSLSGTPVARRCESHVAYDWASGAPGVAGVPSDKFSVRWDGLFEFEGGEYEFVARADDGVRVYVDGKRIIDSWHDQSATDHSGRVTLSRGQHRVQMEYYENGGLAAASLRWSKPAPR